MVVWVYEVPGIGSERPLKNEYRLLLVLAANIVMLTLVSSRFILEPMKPAVQADRPRFAVICNSPGSGWDALCRGIDRAAGERDVAVEYIVSAFSGEDADASGIRMAVESRVDGIAILPSSGGSGEAIAYAAERGIPVVTMVYDEPESGEDVFVGADAAAYGESLLEAVRSFGGEAENVGLIYSGEANRERVEAAERTLGRQYALRTVSRASSHIFDASETVKELSMDSGDLEVICCMDDNTTQGAAQAVVDWNMVNKLCIIGTGESDNLLSMVEKGVVAGVILTDYQQIGQSTVTALSLLYQGEPAPRGGGAEGFLRVVTRETAAPRGKEGSHGA